MTTTPTLWKALTQANTTDGGFAQFEPDILALPNGGYIITWTDATGGDPTIRGQRYDMFGNKAGGELTLQNNADPDGQGALALRPNGSVALAFVNSVGADGNIYLSLPDLFFAATIANSAKSEFAPAVATLKNGGHVVTYTVADSSDDIYAQIVNPNGSLGALIPVSTTAFDSEHSQVEVLSNGNFVVVYDQEFNPTTNPGDFDVLYKIYSPTGTFIAGAFVSGAANLDVAEAFPDVAALKGGRFVVVWEDGAGDSDGVGVRMSLYNNDGFAVAGRTDILVNTAQAGDQYDATVAALNDGGYLVTWRDSAFAAHGQRFDALGNPVGGEFTIDAAGVEFNPVRATVLADGRIAVAVRETTGLFDSDIFTAIFDPRTSPINGTSGHDELTSRRNGATVNGLNGDDELFGFEGKDKLNGGKGKDLLTGGAGRDVFDFDSIKESVKGSKRDKIMDFKRGQDHIDVKDIDAESGGGNQKFEWIGKSKFHDEKGELRYIDKGATVIVQGDTNGDGKADFEIWVGAGALAKGDFVL